ncbi:MAG: redox-sensing transcriptional repressor Rex [Armatimonadota bacterium]|nr:redox-sensing transcriptional repressor Rex [bacterium]
MVPKAVILRFESYLTYLGQLKHEGKKTATSEELARLFGISSSRVRQDLVALGAVGKPRSGYDIAELEKAIIAALDVDNVKKIALVGFGNLGRALAGSEVWRQGGFELRAIFDKDPAVIGTEVHGLKVRNITELFGVIKSEKIEAACITVPASAAQSVADLLVTAGIRGVWNFSPFEIAVPPDVIVENMRLEQGLMTLSFRMRTIKK